MKELNFELFKPYEVKWVDSCGTPAGWIGLEDDYPTDIMRVTTYGTVINKSEDAIVVAQSYNEGNNDNIMRQAMGIVTIPMACITEATPIGVSCQVSVLEPTQRCS